MNNKYVYVFKSAYGTTNVVNYDSNNTPLNEFLSLFDVWNSEGVKKDSEIWFECPVEFLKAVNSDYMKKAFEKFGVKVVTSPPECAF